MRADVRYRWLIGPMALLPGFAPAGGVVEVAVTNVRASEGIIHVELCPERLFLKKCPYVGEATAQRGTTLVTIRGVAPGRYAAQGYHDRNRNGKADRNLIGMPTEDVGFSNDALVALSPPKFTRAAFDHAGTSQRITFRMRSVP